MKITGVTGPETAYLLKFCVTHKETALRKHQKNCLRSIRRCRRQDWIGLDWIGLNYFNLYLIAGKKEYTSLIPHSPDV
jgi:hypothetical protein